jgi:hypothetical protein
MEMMKSSQEASRKAANKACSCPSRVWPPKFATISCGCQAYQPLPSLAKQQQQQEPKHPQVKGKNATRIQANAYRLQTKQQAPRCRRVM